MPRNPFFHHTSYALPIQRNPAKMTKRMLWYAPFIFEHRNGARIVATHSATIVAGVVDIYISGASSTTIKRAQFVFSYQLTHTIHGDNTIQPCDEDFAGSPPVGGSCYRVQAGTYKA